MPKSGAVDGKAATPFSKARRVRYPDLVDIPPGMPDAPATGGSKKCRRERGYSDRPSSGSTALTQARALSVRGNPI